MRDRPTHGCCNGLALLYLLIVGGVPICMLVMAVILVLVLK